jgi:hypothetical protein
VSGKRHALAVLPLKKDPFPFCRRLNGPQGRSGLVLKISPPPAFDPLTVQLVASRYIDYDNPALSIAIRNLVLYSLGVGLEFLLLVVLYLPQLLPKYVYYCPKIILSKKNKYYTIKIQYEVDRQLTNKTILLRIYRKTLMSLKPVIFLYS